MLVCCTQLCLVLHGWCATLVGAAWCCAYSLFIFIRYSHTRVRARRTHTHAHTYRHVSLRLGINSRRKTKAVVYAVRHAKRISDVLVCFCTMDVAVTLSPARRARLRTHVGKGFADVVTVRTSARFRSRGGNMRCKLTANANLGWTTA